VRSLLLTIALVSYLLGSIHCGYLLMRIFHGVDVRIRGSLIIIRHKDNIRRLVAGTENRLGKTA